MSEINLTRGLVAVVDDEDFALVAQYRWQAFRCRTAKTWYARTRIYPEKIEIYMHQLIYPAPDGLEVDHADMNGLNNRRGNLRHSTRSQNMANRVWTKGRSKTGFRGVYLHGTRFQAHIRVNGRGLFLGSFKNAIDAATAYDAAAVHHFGEFSQTNFGKCCTQA